MMAALAVPFALVAVPAMGATAYTCDNVSNVKAIDLPVAVPTPGGKQSSTIYYDDRPTGNIKAGPVTLPVGDGYVQGEGTWIYFETDGISGLQRGGQSSLPTTPLTGANDFEICQGGCASWGANQTNKGCSIHDELVF